MRSGSRVHTEVRTANLSTEEKIEPPMNATERSEMDEHFDSKMSQMDTDMRQLIFERRTIPIRILNSIQIG